MMLLDVNVLIALAWTSHEHHPKAQNWFLTHSPKGWATCALTETAFVRLSCNPALTPHALKPSHAREFLCSLIEQPRHHYFSVIPSLIRNEFSKIWPLITNHHHVTDAYLIGIAHHHKAKLLTFDQNLARLSPWPGLVEVLKSL
jgi:hypothetical protein